MRALKGVLIYIGIVLGIIVGLGLILLCVMYFVPSVRIFGISLVKYKKTVSADPIVLSDYENYSDIEININAKKVNLNVLPSEINDINYNLSLNVFGFSNEIVEYKVAKTIDIVDETLKIFLTISEPNGWINMSNSKLDVIVPANLDYKLLVNTTSGDVALGKTGLTSKVTGLTVNTGSGNLSLVNMGVGEDEKTLNLTSLNFNTKSGNFDLSKITNINVENKVNLNADDGYFKFNNLNSSLDVTGNDVRIDANKINCGSDGFNVIVKNGYFNIKYLNGSVGAENTIITDNTVVDIENIVGKTGIVTIYGEVKIGTTNDQTMIENTNGRVTVNTAKDKITVKTYMGDIRVDKYLKSGKFTSVKGDIIVNSTSDYVDGYSTKIENVDGLVDVENKINLLEVKTTGRSKVKVKFGVVKDGFKSEQEAFEHKIITNKTEGSCEVLIPTDKTVYFKFTAKGNISGEISGFNGDNNYYKVEASDNPQYFPNSDYANEENTKLNASFWFEGKIKFIGNA